MLGLSILPSFPQPEPFRISGWQFSIPRYVLILSWMNNFNEIYVRPQKCMGSPKEKERRKQRKEGIGGERSIWLWLLGLDNYNHIYNFIIFS